MSKLIDLNLKTNGILLMSDDVLLKHWNLNGLNSDNYWYIQNPKCGLDFKSRKSWPWDVEVWFAGKNGEQCIIKTFDSIKKIVNDFDDGTNKKVFEKFIQMYKINLNESSNDTNKILSKICKDGSDVFYLPKNLFYDFTQTDIEKYYNQIKHFSHPVKLSKYNTHDTRRLICQYFINDKFKHL